MYLVIVYISVAAPTNYTYMYNLWMQQPKCLAARIQILRKLMGCPHSAPPRRILQCVNVLIKLKKKSSGRSSSEVALSKVPASSVVNFRKQLHLHTLTVHPNLAAQEYFWQGRFLKEQPFTMFLRYV